MTGGWRIKLIFETDKTRSENNHNIIPVQNKRGTAKSLFIRTGGRKMAPSGRIDPKFCMHRAFGMLIPKI